MFFRPKSKKGLKYTWKPKGTIDERQRKFIGEEEKPLCKSKWWKSWESKAKAIIFSIMSFLAVIITLCISFLLFYRSSPTPVTYAVLCWRLNVLTNASDKSKLSRKVLRLARQNLPSGWKYSSRNQDRGHFPFFVISRIKAGTKFDKYGTMTDCQRD